MSNRILVPVVLVVVGATAWLCLDRGPLSLHADSARPARLGVAAALAGQAAPAGPFRMKTVTNGANWQAYRYNASTGETMQMVNLKFQKLTEAGTIPTGEYELDTTPLGPNGYAGYAVVRLERVSGRCWFLQGNNWAEIQ
jgi:hypothetical protein